MLHFNPGYNQFSGQPQDSGEPESLTWLDYIILSNPAGVMKVLSDHGYTGYLAPKGEDEMMDCCLEMMDKEGEPAVVDLIKSHPLYETISEMSREEVNLRNPFKNAAGESDILAVIKTINYQSLIENALIIIGAIYLAGKVWSYFVKE